MKSVLVTGASGGLGSATVRALIEKGYFVFGLDRNPTDFNNPSYFHVQADITKEESVRNAFLTVSEKTEGLDAVVNTAGIMFMGSLVEQSAELMQKIMDVNLTGTCRVNQIFFPLVEKVKGRFVVFSSEYGRYTTIPFHAFYTASKHAVESYADGLRREMKYLGIKVITVRPGAFDTAMSNQTYPFFREILETTTHYKKVYQRLEPFLKNGTKRAKSPSVLAQVVAKAVSVKHPKRIYKVNHDVLVKILSVLPSGLIDLIFKVLG